MGRCLGVEPAMQGAVQQGVEGLGDLVGADVPQRGLAEQEGRQPVADRVAQRAVRQVRPGLALGGAQKGDAVAPLRPRRRPGQAIDPEPPQSLGEGTSRRLVPSGRATGSRPARSRRAA